MGENPLFKLLRLLGRRLLGPDLVILTNHGGGRMTIEARIAGEAVVVSVPRRQSIVVWPAGQAFLDQLRDDARGPIGLPALAEEPLP